MSTTVTLFQKITHNDKCTGWHKIIYVQELLNAESASGSGCVAMRFHLSSKIIFPHRVKVTYNMGTARKLMPAKTSK
jgi:hypothetical protein